MLVVLAQALKCTRYFILLGMQILLFVRSAQAEPSNPIVGTWETVDDQTQQVKSLVELSSDGQVVTGKVVKILDAKADPDARCHLCQGALHDKPILGMTFLWGLRPNDAARRSWEHGTVLDPSNGKEYRCRVRLLDDGRLEIRGFVGVPLFGRSQTWHRAKVTSPTSP